jgi:hypothetical protein
VRSSTPVSSHTSHSRRILVLNRRYTLEHTQGYGHQQCSVLHRARGRFPHWVSVLPADPRLGYISRPQHHRLLGTLARKASLLSTYASYLGYSIGIQIVIDGLYLWAFFSKSRSELIERCIDGSTDQQVEDICNNFFNAGKWTILGGMIVGLLIQFCESHENTCISTPFG